MRDAVSANLSKTAIDMPRLVWPAIRDWLGGGDYFPVESVAGASLTKDLDMLAGIDGFQKRPEKGVMRGIASRIQWGNQRWGDKDWHTFSLRKSRSSQSTTEIPKRLWQLQHRHEGYLYPHITSQAYVNEKRTALISVAVAYTHELIPWAVKTFSTLEVFERTVAYNDAGVWECIAYDRDGSSAKFLAVDWDKYEASGFFIKQWHCTEQTILGEPTQQFLEWVEEMEAMQV